MKRVALVVMLVLAWCSAANAAQLFQARAGGSGWVCSDKTVMPELHDLAMHDPNNPYIAKLATHGNCSPILANFTVIGKETLKVPAGPQKLVEIAIPNATDPSMPPDTAWMMESDIEPVKQP